MSNEQLKQCLTIGDSTKALNCLKKAVQEAQGTCKPRLVLVTTTEFSCDSCDQVKAQFSKDIRAGIIQEIDMQSAEGQRIANNNDLDAVPALLLLDCNDKVIPLDD